MLLLLSAAAVLSAAPECCCGTTLSAAAVALTLTAAVQLVHVRSSKYVTVKQHKSFAGLNSQNVPSLPPHTPFLSHPFLLTVEY